jgi:hypothetical protein
LLLDQGEAVDRATAPLTGSIHVQRFGGVFVVAELDLAAVDLVVRLRRSIVKTTPLMPFLSFAVPAKATRVFFVRRIRWFCFGLVMTIVGGTPSMSLIGADAAALTAPWASVTVSVAVPAPSRV